MPTRPAASSPTFSGGVAPSDGAPAEIPIDGDDALGNEWAVIIDAPATRRGLVAWEQPGITEPGGPATPPAFEAIWTIDPQATRRATQVAAAAGRSRSTAPFGERLQSCSPTGRWRWRSRRPR